VVQSKRVLGVSFRGIDWRRSFKIVGCTLGIVGAAALVVFLLFGVVIAFIFHVPYPPQPKFGFAGNWRTPDVLGFEERPLPPASQVWKDYEGWHPATNEYTRRVYLARLGGAARQTGIRSSISSGDTPMGAQWYTHVEFFYADPTNGTYILSWTLRGKHDTDFLRFNATERLYQLQPYGEPGEQPPRLSIIGIEGVRPEN
jgi:hypothetical protein